MSTLMSAGGGALPLPGVTPPTGPSPVTAPRQEGLEAAARVEIAKAVKALIAAVSVLGGSIGGELGRDVTGALKTLARYTPEIPDGLMGEGQQKGPAQQPGAPAPMLGARPRPVPLGMPQVR